MKKRYKLVLSALIFLFLSLTLTAIGMSFAYYETSVTGAVSSNTSAFEPELSIVSETHTVVPASNVAVDEIKFYVKNYTGSDSSPTISEVKLKYILTFTLPTWGTGCTNPISYKLYSVNQTTNAENEITLTNNATSAINFTLIDAEKHYYKLKLYWNTTYNSTSCFAGKSKNVGISADISQV